MTPIYLDYNATTPIHLEVLAAMRPYLEEHFGNPSSDHLYGRRAKEGVERARAQVAGLVGCSPEELVFTGTGTEASNLAVRGVLAGSRRRRVVTSVVEHPATASQLAFLEALGVDVVRMPVGPDGRVPLSALVAIDERAALVTLIHAQNETGVLQPVAEAGRAARAAGALLHVDAAQSLGKVPVRVDELGADLLSIVGHKLYAPKGVGALYVRRGVAVDPVVLGASHERGLRPGTENVPGIVGLGAACELAGRELSVESARQRALRERLWAALVAAAAGVRRNGDPDHVLPNTLSVRFPGASGSAVLLRAPELAASTGSACHAGHEEPSRVLLEMGLPPADALGTVRLTLGRGTTEAEVDRAAAALGRAFAELAR